GFFIHGLWSGSPPDTRGRSPVRKSRTPGSVRGVSGNGYPYRDALSDTNLSRCKSCIRVNAMNVHKSYQTITHYHFDWLTPAGDYPKSAIMVVECKDGRWMIVQEFGEDYGCFEGVLKNECDLITKPTFYPDLRSAAMSGFGMMKQLYPLYDDNLFNEFLSEVPE
ncbi:hypothetical protein ABUJ19_28175, partial [Klebsiella pneumoniae]